MSDLIVCIPEEGGELKKIMHTTLSTGVAGFGIGYSDKIRKHVGYWNIYTFKPKISQQIFGKFNAQIILCLTVFDRHKIISK